MKRLGAVLCSLWFAGLAGCAGRYQGSYVCASGARWSFDCTAQLLTKTDAQSTRYADGSVYSIGASDQTPLVNAWAWGQAAKAVGTVAYSEAVTDLVNQ